MRSIRNATIHGVFIDYWVSLIPFRIEDEKIGVRVVDRLGRPTITHSECEYQRSQCKCRCEALTGSLFFSHDFLPVLAMEEMSSAKRLS